MSTLHSLLHVIHYNQIILVHHLVGTLTDYFLITELLVVKAIEENDARTRWNGWC